MNILGINAYHGDAAACLVVDGRLVAAVEEERFRRIKHWAGFPEQSIRWCLEHAGLKPAEIDHVAVGRDPSAHMAAKLLYALRNLHRVGLLRDRGANRARLVELKVELCRALEVEPRDWRPPIHFVEHHRAHLASSFFLSPFDEAACVSIDGFGDFVSTTVAVGRANRLQLKRSVRFPHSLGAFYTAATQYLGFPRYGDEYKMMGLAASGEPAHRDAIADVIHPVSQGGFRLNARYFRHPREAVDLNWDGGAPDLGAYFSEAWSNEFGPARSADEPLDQRHRDLARSVQVRTEEIIRHVLDHAFEESGDRNLALSGGCALNSVANGKITTETGFERMYVPPAAGDAGTAVGAALSVWHETLGQPRRHNLDGAALGPGYSDAQIARALGDAGLAHEWATDDGALVERVVERIEAGNVVGWFQGRAEWGPRALGQRSILADPRRSEMRDLLNDRIKQRESFRPFAPSMPEEVAPEYFERLDPAPFMSQTYSVRPQRRAEIPAVVHVDGSARVQTVRRQDQPLFHELLCRFGNRTGTPVLLNTSFNENEPIVRSPREAIDCFRRTRMDLLVLGRAIAYRDPGQGDDRGS